MLIDLGHEWGHIVPLEVLTNITRISYNAHEVSLYYMNGDEEVSLKSNGVLDTTKMVAEIMSIINGVVPKERMKAILRGIEQQSGKTIPDILDKQIPDIGALRKLWAEVNDEPFMQFGLSYDKENDSVSFDVDFNDDFKNVMEKWLDRVTMEVVQSDEEKALIFVMEALKQAVEPMKPGDNSIPDDELPTMIQPTQVNF